jgi:predicted nucleic acid-binding protein
MHLVDTSVWSDHLRRHDSAMARLLEAGDVLAHPFVTGELACGVFPRRAEALALLDLLPSAPLIGQSEVLGFIDRHDLAGRGIGFVDVHLLASARVAGALLWTRDKRLANAADGLGVGARQTR